MKKDIPVIPNVAHTHSPETETLSAALYDMFLKIRELSHHYIKSRSKEKASTEE